MNRTLWALGALSLSLTASAVPLTTSHQGRLFDADGEALEGEHSVSIRLWSQSAGGTQLWEEVQDVEFNNGYFSVTLGKTAPISAASLDQSELYVSLTVDGGTELQRIAINSAPYAILAGSVKGGTVDASEIKVNGTTIIGSDGQISGGLASDLLDGDDDALGDLDCNSGEIPKYDGTSWVCASDSDHDHDADQISGVFSVDQLPVGTDALSVASGDHTHALGTLSGQLSAAQLPSNFGALVDTAATDGALALAAGSTVGGQPIATGAGYNDAAALNAVLADFVKIGRNDSRVGFAGNWVDHPGWGLNRLKPNEARYTQCEGNVDCSAAYVELRLDNNAYSSVMMSHLDWSNARTIGVYVSYDGGTNFALHKLIDTFRSDPDNSPHTSQNRMLITNLPSGANVRVRVVAVKGRMHFEGFGLSKQSFPETDNSPLRQTTWVQNRGNDTTCDTEGTCGPSPLAARTMTFIKTNAASSVRVSYTDNMRSYGAGGERACRWHIYFNGQPCAATPIFGDVYSSGSSNEHQQRTIVGYCPGLPAGSYTVQAYVSNTPGYGARCYTGWSGSTFMMEAEEVR